VTPAPDGTEDAPAAEEDAESDVLG
jgi:hypothetical protein